MPSFMVKTVTLISHWLPPLCWAGVIFALSEGPGPSLPPRWHGLLLDKVAHFLCFAVLALLLCRAFRAHGYAFGFGALLAFVLSSAYGALDEWHQSLVPGRHVETADWLADTLGAASVFLLGWSDKKREPAE